MSEKQPLPRFCKLCFFGTTGECKSPEVASFAADKNTIINQVVEELDKNQRCDFAHNKDPKSLSAIQKGYKVAIQKTKGKRRLVGEYEWLTTIGPDRNINLQDGVKGKDK